MAPTSASAPVVESISTSWRVRAIGSISLSTKTLNQNQKLHHGGTEPLRKSKAFGFQPLTHSHCRYSFRARICLREKRPMRMRFLPVVLVLAAFCPLPAPAHAKPEPFDCKPHSTHSQHSIP